MANLTIKIFLSFAMLTSCGHRTPQQACEDMCEKAVTCGMLDARLAKVCKKACLHGGKQSDKCYKRTKKAVLCMDDLVCGEGTCAVEIINLIECWPEDIFNGQREQETPNR